MFIVAFPPSPAMALKKEWRGDPGRYAVLKCASDWSNVTWKHSQEFTTQRRRTLGNIATASGTKGIQPVPAFMLGVACVPHLMSSSFGPLSYGWRTWIIVGLPMLTIKLVVVDEYQSSDGWWLMVDDVWWQLLLVYECFWINIRSMFRENLGSSPRIFLLKRWGVELITLFVGCSWQGDDGRKRDDGPNPSLLPATQNPTTNIQVITRYTFEM